MEHVFTESRYWWKPAILPFTTSPLSGVLNGFGPIGIPGGQLSSGHRYQRISQAYP